MSIFFIYFAGHQNFHQNFEISHQDTKAQSYIKGFIKKNPWCLCALVAIFIWVNAYQIAVFSFPCMVPVAFNKRIFYNFKALNGKTFPFFAVPFFLSPPFPHLKYTISPYQVDDFPIKSSTSPEPKYYRSPAQVPLVPRQKWTQ